MSRSHGIVSDKRKHQARKHANRPHTCSECGGIFYGNGFYNHFRWCILKKYPDLKWMSGKYLRREYYKRNS